MPLRPVRATLAAALTVPALAVALALPAGADRTDADRTSADRTDADRTAGTSTPASPAGQDAAGTSSVPASAAPVGPSATTDAPADFVNLHEAVPTIHHDIRYWTRHNFIGRRIAGYEEPRCLLTEAAADRLARVQADVRSQGFTLKVYDCYRPQRAVNDFVSWSGTRYQMMKEEFFPRVAKSRLFSDGYIARRSGHSRGSTIDLTLVKLPAADQPAWRPSQGLQRCYWPKWTRYPDNSIDMGTGYDCFDTRSHTDSPAITADQRRKRNILRTAMESQGFSNYANEWWHYSLDDEPYPSTYFDFPVAASSVD